MADTELSSCFVLQGLMSQLPYIAGRLFVDSLNQKHQHNSEKAIEKMTDNLRNAFDKETDVLSWMSKQDKKTASEKAKNMVRVCVVQKELLS